MGGIHLTSPDFPQGFPINAQQLHYLIVHGYIDPPDMEKMDVTERNSADTLSRVITIFQAFWFFVGELERFAQGLPITTLELTTISFTLVMFATSATWYYKPSIAQPRFVHTKNDIAVQEIRENMARYTHPMLPAHWYQTPLEFIGHDHFGINIHWRYYTRLAQILHIRLFSRPVTSRPYDRFPSDTWLCPDFVFTPLATCVLLGFSGLFLIAWNFHFPTYAEKILWRISSVYHAVFSIYGGFYFVVEMVKSRRRPLETDRVLKRSGPLTRHHSFEGLITGSPSAFRGTLSRWRNISVDNDPEMSVSMRVLLPVSIMCILYVFARVYIYVEDFASLRSQPSGVYIDVNKFLPFLG
ncbi:uncharacterized protein LDX57_007133 [Aspergillus melleus]|uniref:uncharacterized protein n=1 Tax=Aspergillus melleus TaxID=138277 RepID=UPI001E8D7492|nr:uncharacterized protein LDX57_007133 [Aspergillus melleus]KAH8429471.1 hypothetical protein LDX57_007133 [Aspergillus melleus]